MIWVSGPFSGLPCSVEARKLSLLGHEYGLVGYCVGVGKAAFGLRASVTRRGGPGATSERPYRVMQPRTLPGLMLEAGGRAWSSTRVWGALKKQGRVHVSCGGKGIRGIFTV